MGQASKIIRGGVLILLLLVFLLFLVLGGYREKSGNRSSRVGEKQTNVSLESFLSSLPVRERREVKLEGYPYKHLVLKVDSPLAVSRELSDYLSDRFRYWKSVFRRTYYFRLEKPVSGYSAIVVGKYFGKPVLGLLIDDVGNKWRLLKKIAAEVEPVSFAIFPFEVFSRRSSRLLRERNFQLLLHLPMEPMHYRDPRMIRGMIVTSMSSREIGNVIGKAIDNLGRVVGVNNHIGSKFTSDPDAMRKLLRVLADRKMFFIDSYTVAGSVGWKEAFKMGVPTAKRDVFIDNSLDVGYIEKMWNRAVEKALSRGRVLVIGHLHPQTVKVVMEELERLKDRGIEPVFVSDLLF